MVLCPQNSESFLFGKVVVKLTDAVEITVDRLWL